MELKECVLWLKILKANLKLFPEISVEKKIKALEKAIMILEKMEEE